jgi:hypothetical protein
MRTSSKVALIAGFCMLVVFGASYYQLQSASMPDLTREGAHALLAELSEACRKGRVSRILSFVAPDAQIAGRTPRQIEPMLARGLQFVKEPEVTFQDVTYTRDGETVTLSMVANVRDLSTKETLYSAPVTMTLTRRAIAHVGGLFTTYEWKITRVDAVIPSE